MSSLGLSWPKIINERFFLQASVTFFAHSTSLNAAYRSHSWTGFFCFFNISSTICNFERNHLTFGSFPSIYMSECASVLEQIHVGIWKGWLDVLPPQAWLPYSISFQLWAIHLPERNPVYRWFYLFSLHICHMIIQQIQQIEWRKWWMFLFPKDCMESNYPPHDSCILMTHLFSFLTHLSLSLIFRIHAKSAPFSVRKVSMVYPQQHQSQHWLWFLF